MKFKMAKGTDKRTGHWKIAPAIVCHLGPATGRQTNIGPMQIGQKRAVSARSPAKNVQQAGDGVFPRPVYGRLEIVRFASSEIFRERSISGSGGRRDRPSRCLAFIETEDTANFWIDFQFAKVRRLFGPLHTPAYAADEIAFVNAVPCRSSNLHEQEPAQSCGEVGSRDCGLRIADCGLRILIAGF